MIGGDGKTTDDGAKKPTLSGRQWLSTILFVGLFVVVMRVIFPNSNWGDLWTTIWYAIFGLGVYFLALTVIVKILSRRRGR